MASSSRFCRRALQSRQYQSGFLLQLKSLCHSLSGTKADGKGSEEKKDRACDDQPVGVTEVGRAAVVCGVDAVPGNYEEYAVDNEGDKADQECEETARLNGFSYNLARAMQCSTYAKRDPQMSPILEVPRLMRMVRSVRPAAIGWSTRA